MTTLTVTAKGQVTLRKDVLAHLRIGPGDRIDVQKLPGGRIEVRATRRTGNISDVFGALKRENGPRFTIEELKEFTEKAWAGEE